LALRKVIMKVILEKDVVGLGKRGDLKEVKEGYFRNFLMPVKLAVLATKEKIRGREREVMLKDKAKKLSEEKIAEDINKLSGQTITLEGKINEKGSLYKAVTTKDIAKKLGESGFAGISANWIMIEKPHKEAGKFEVEIKNPEGKSAKIFIEIREQH